VLVIEDLHAITKYDGKVYFWEIAFEKSGMLHILFLTSRECALSMSLVDLFAY